MLCDENIKIYNYFFEIAKQKGDKKFYVASNHQEKGLFSVLEKKEIIDYFDNIFCLSKMNVQKEYFYKDIKILFQMQKKLLYLKMILKF